MCEDSDQKIEVAFSKETMEMLTACAEWRQVSVEKLICAYVEDWLDVDYPESQGRLTRRGIHRDGPIGLDPGTQQTASRN